MTVFPSPLIFAPFPPMPWSVEPPAGTSGVGRDVMGFGVGVGVGVGTAGPMDEDASNWLPACVSVGVGTAGPMDEDAGKWLAACVVNHAAEYTPAAPAEPHRS